VIISAKLFDDEGDTTEEQEEARSCNVEERRRSLFRMGVNQIVLVCEILNRVLVEK